MTFDPVGRLTSRVASQGEQREEETFAYDGNGRLIQAINAASKLYSIEVTPRCCICSFMGSIRF